MFFFECSNNLFSGCSKFDRLRHVEIVEHHEHLDLVWAVDAEERVTKPILKLLRDEPSWMSEPDRSS